MKLASFRSGQSLTINSIVYRIFRIDENANFQLERAKDLAIITKTKEQLLALLEAGEMQFHDLSDIRESPKSSRPPSLSVLDDMQQVQAMRCYEYIKACNQSVGNQPVRTGIEPVIEAVAQRIGDESKPSSITVYRWWSKYVNSGYDITSLVQGKRGPKKSRTYGKSIEAILAEVLEEVCLTREQVCWQAGYDAFCSRLLSLNRMGNQKYEIPSRATFYRMRYQVLDPYQVMVARKGKRAADRHFRTVGKGVSTARILERVEVDHTPTDVMVLNEKTGLPDGRATITLLLDCYSRMPLGFSIGFEPPSQLSVMRALRNAILPKTYVQEAYPDISHEWPCYGIPEVLVCDNGLEFHSEQLKRMCAELDIELVFCPKKRPEYKGSVERFLGTLNRSVCHRISGTTFSNINDRGDYNSVEEASITLSELTRLIHLWILDVYAQDLHRILLQTPSTMWLTGQHVIEPRLPESRDQLDLVLTHQYQRTLSHEGVQFFNLHYNCEELGALRRRSRGKVYVFFRVDPENLGSIWVFDEVANQYIVVPCLSFDYANGLSLRQHHKVRKMRLEKGRGAVNNELLLEHKEKLRVEIQEIGTKKSLRKRTKAARLRTPALDESKPTSTTSSNSTLDFEMPLDIPELDVEPIGGKGDE